MEAAAPLPVTVTEDSASLEEEEEEALISVEVPGLSPEPLVPLQVPAPEHTAALPVEPEDHPEPAVALQAEPEGSTAGEEGAGPKGAEQPAEAVEHDEVNLVF